MKVSFFLTQWRDFKGGWGASVCNLLDMLVISYDETVDGVLWGVY